MPCMEVWGGNQAVNYGVVMSGLDAWLYSRPYDEGSGGGDVHYVSSCATGRITRMLVADVAGHGDAVASISDALRHLMRRYVNHIDQTRFVMSLNREFAALTDGGRFATSIVATFFSPTSTLSLSNAGHPWPLLYRRKSGQWSVIQPPERSRDAIADLPLGIVEQSSYSRQDLSLGVGDLVILYTDALPESRNADGEELGTQGLLEMVRGLDPQRPDELVAALLAAVRERAGGRLDGDDVTVLLIRPNGLAPRVPWKDRVLAPLRVARGVGRAIVRRGEPAPLPEASLVSLGGAFVTALNRRGRRRTGSN